MMLPSTTHRLLRHKKTEKGEVKPCSQVSSTTASDEQAEEKDKNREEAKQ